MKIVKPVTDRPLPQPPRWPWGLYALAAVLLVLGQVRLASGAFGPGLLLSAAAVVLGLAGFVLPTIPWVALRTWVTGLRLRPPTMGSPMVLVALGRTALGALAAGPHLFGEDRLELPRWLLLVPAVVAGVLMQWWLLQGQVVRAILMLVGAVPWVVIFLQGMGRPLVVPHTNRLGAAGLGLLASLPPTLWGMVLLWQYRYVMTGWGLTTLGGAIALTALWRFPVTLDEGATPSGPSLKLSWSFASREAWAATLPLKAALLAGAGVCAFLSMQVFGLNRLGLSVASAFAGMALLMASFPWLPIGFSDLGLPAPLAPALGLALALVGFALGLYGQHRIDAGAVRPGLWAFLGGAVLVALGLGHQGAEPRGDGDRADGVPGAVGPEPLWAHQGEALALLAFFLLVWWMRIWNLGHFPWGSEGDEAGGGIFAMQALKGLVENPIITQNVPLHFFSITSVFFKYFGVSVATLRWHAAIFGTLGVIAFYFLARLFFGRWIAFLTALLMACAHWHLHFSRFGHYMAEQLACQTVAFYFVFKGMRTGRLWQWAVGGIAFGLAMLPALASRLLPFEGLALVLYLLLARRDLFRRHLNGFLVFVISAWMLASPCLVYWARVIPLSMGRAASVSIFDKTNTNAPVDTLSGFVANCKSTMLMFNETGDSRSRDNPLPSQKMLEGWTAVLFGLAFLFTLYHWRDSLNLFLLAAFFINLSASIFSVEAPQSHRTSPNIPIIFMMIAVMLWDLRRAFLGLGRRWGQLLFVVLLLPAFTFFSVKAAEKYFVEARGLAFDVAPTEVGLKCAQVGTKDDQGLFWASGFACSHPPVQLFKQDVPVGNYYNMADYWPVSLAPGKRHLMFMVDDYQDFNPWIRSLYPHAKEEAIPDIRGGRPIATFFDLKPSDIAAIQGLAATSGPHSVRGAALAWPVAGLPRGAVRFNGSLSLHWFGFYTFAASGLGDVRLDLDGRTVLERKNGVTRALQVRLPRGLTRLQAELKGRGAGDHIEISYTGLPHPAHQLYSLTSLTHGTVERTALFSMAPQGFYGRYYLGRRFQGDAVMEYCEPSLLAHWLDSPFPEAWSAVWKAKLTPPMDGHYGFNMVNNGGYDDIWVNGRLVGRGGPPVADAATGSVLPGVNLKAGRPVELKVRFATTGPSWMELKWSTPDGKGGLVPPWVLQPDPR